MVHSALFSSYHVRSARMRVQIASIQPGDEVLIREAVSSLGQSVCELQRCASPEPFFESLRKLDSDLLVVDAGLDVRIVGDFLNKIKENFSTSGTPILVLGSRKELQALGDVVRAANVETFCRDEEDNRHLQRAIITVLQKLAAHRAFEARFRFERIITTIASRFINFPPHQLNNRLESALGLVGRFARVDRAFIILYEERDRTVRMTHEWCAEGIPSAKQFYTAMPFPANEWPIDLLRRGETVAVARKEHLPSHAQMLHSIMTTRGIHSFALVPLIEDEKFLGVLGLSTLREARAWAREDVSLMKMVGEIFVSAVRHGKMESALEESEIRYKTLIESLGEGIIFTDRDDTVLHINSRLTDLTGYSSSELIGKAAYEALLLPEDIEEMHAHTARRLQGISETYEIRLRRKDGTIFWAEINATPIFNPLGEIVATLGAVTDISERRIAQDALDHQRRFLKEVINTDPNIIFVKDASGVITLANQALSNLYQIPLEQIIGQNEGQFVKDPRVLARYHKEDALVMASGERFVLPEGCYWDPVRQEERWFQTIKTRLTNERGEPAVLIVANEITERKRAEEEAIALQRQLLQSQKMEAIGQLAAGIAHDLNNSLAAVVGHLQLMAMDRTMGGPLQRSLQVALSGCEKASSLIERLLGFSRQGKYNLETLSLAKIAEDTVAFLERIIGNDIAIRWCGTEQILDVHVDEAQLQQALTNLIINARQAMPQGGEITFEFSTRIVEHPGRFNPKARPGDYVCLTVRDTGTGIDPSHLDKIFEPFFTTKSNASGTGLGLAMVYGIMQHHGGWVEVSSTVGSGTSFTLYLPRARAAVNSTQSETPSLSPAKERVRIMVIDDEQALVDLTSQFLELAGYEPVPFTVPEQALEWYRTNHRSVALVIMDMKMPHMDGTQMFRELRAIAPDAQVVVLSGYINDEAARRLIDQGALKFFQKPLQYPELVEWISGLLRFRSKQRASAS